MHLSMNVFLLDGVKLILKFYNKLVEHLCLSVLICPVMEWKQYK